MTINDDNWQFLHDATGLSLPFNDMYFRYLRDQGYTGTLQDMIAASGLGMNPSDEWTPLSLGAGLYDAWDAERSDSLVLSGATVTSWASIKNGYSAAQSIAASKPIYGTTSINGRPGLTFDGADDYLTYTGVGVFPTGANPVEVWMLLDQQWLATETPVKIPFSYGGNTAATRRRLHRQVVTGVNNFGVGAGDGAVEVIRNNGSVDFTGRHVVRGIWTGTTISASIDGIGSTTSPVVPATGTLRTRIGATTSDTPGAYSKVVLSYLAVTALLSEADAALMLAYLKTRGGIA